MSQMKVNLTRDRLKLTTAAMRVYHEKYLKGEVPTPFDTLEEIMLQGARDSDRVNAAKEMIRMFYQRPPSESEVVVNDERSGASLTQEEKIKLEEDLRLLMMKATGDSDD